MQAEEHLLLRPGSSVLLLGQRSSPGAEEPLGLETHLPAEAPPPDRENKRTGRWGHWAGHWENRVGILAERGRTLRQQRRARGK